MFAPRIADAHNASAPLPQRHLVGLLNAFIAVNLRLTAKCSRISGWYAVRFVPICGVCLLRCLRSQRGTMQLSVQRRSVEDFEELKGVVPTARTEVTQLDAGRLEGKLSHYLVGDLPLDLASFSLGVRSRGIVSEDRVSIGMLTGCRGRVTHWSHEMRPGDVVVWPPGVEHDARYFGGLRFRSFRWVLPSSLRCSAPNRG
jgi:hypothetical protein